MSRKRVIQPITTKRVVLSGRGPQGYVVRIDRRKVALSTVLHDTMVELFVQRHLTREGYATIESSQGVPEHARLIIHRLRKAIGKNLIANGYKTCYRLEVEKAQLGVDPAFFELKPGVDVGVQQYQQLQQLYPQESIPKGNVDETPLYLQRGPFCTLMDI